MSNVKGILDGKGYVILVDVLGSDLAVVNAARVSFHKESYKLSEADERLILFLARRKETSPFRHCALSFEIKAPLFVARQWWKYAVASTHLDDQNGWNEVSRRYVTEPPEFYVPQVWRSAPDDKKQGSGKPLFPPEGEKVSEALRAVVAEGVRKYEWALTMGVAPEQARLLLPAYAMYTTWRWTVSLAALAHFLEERLADKAQQEMRDYALAVRTLAEPKFPVSLPALWGGADA